MLDVIRGSGVHIFVYGGSLWKLNSWSGHGRKGGGSSDSWISVLAEKTSLLSLTGNSSVLTAFFFPIPPSSGTIAPETWIYWLRRFLAGYKHRRGWSWISHNSCKVWGPFDSLNKDHETDYISAALGLAITKCSSWSLCLNSRERKRCWAFHSQWVLELPDICGVFVNSKSHPTSSAKFTSCCKRQIWVEMEPKPPTHHPWFNSVCFTF